MVCTPIAEWIDGELRPAYMDGYRNNPHLGPYLLAAVLDQAGFDISMVDLTCLDALSEEIVKIFSEYDVILFSSNSTNWPTCRLLIDWIKKEYPTKIIVLGGIHATLFGEDLIQRFPIDYIIRGEGEKSLPSLLWALDNNGKLRDVPGIVCMKNGRLILNPMPQLLDPDELNALPILLYSHMPTNKYKTVAIESSRGCKGSCTFCAIPYHKRWRPLSPLAFVDKVEALQSYLPKVEMKHFAVVDDCFTTNQKRTIDILEEVEKRGVEFRATYDARVKDFLDEEFVSRLAPYSQGLLIGAESFNPDTLRRIGKPVSEKSIINCARIVEKCGISENTIFSFIIGFPWETKSQVQENIRKISELAVNYGVRIFLQWYTLTPGSQMWDSLYKEGKVTVSDMDDIGFLIGEKWFNLSSTLSIEERLEISDMVTCIQKVIAFTKPYGSKRGDIAFIIPPYLVRNHSLTKDWCDSYQQKMGSY